MTTDTAEEVSDAVPAAPSALEGAVTTTDPAVLPRYWMVSGGLGLLASVVAGLLVGLERLDLATMDVFGSADELFQFWSAFRVGLVFLGVLPLLIGLASRIVPLQVGASAPAFPRASALAFWLWLLGGGITVAGFLIDGGVGTPNGGSQTQAVALTLVGLLLAITGILLGTVCILTTIVTGRTAGMTLIRVPMFTWSMLVAGTIWMVTLPVLAANAVLAYVDLRGRAPVRFGAEEAIWEQLSWAFTHPQVYAFALPLLGIAADVLPVAGRLRPTGRNALLVLIGLFGVTSFGAYAQTYFDLGTPVVEETLSVVDAFAAVLVALAFLGGILDYLRRGIANVGSRPPAAFVLSLLSVLLLFAATVVGAVHRIEPLELAGRSVGGAQMVLTLGAAGVAIVAGMAWWGDRAVGSATPQAPLFGGGLAIALGVGLVGIAETISGFMGLRDFTGDGVVAAGSPDYTVDTLNVVGFAGYAVVAVGVLGVLAAGISHLRSTTPGAADPWGGHTLEWANGPVEVTSAEPLLDTADEGSA